MQQVNGRTEEAIDFYKQALNANENDTKAWIMIGQAQANNNDKLCKRSFEKVLKSCDKDDLYTHVALGNYHASAAREMKSEKQSGQVNIIKIKNENEKSLYYQFYFILIIYLFTFYAS